MKKVKEKWLALIFQQGGTLRNICVTEDKDKVENFMKLFYDFPFYAQYVPFNRLLDVSDMLTIHGMEDARKHDLKDMYINIEAKGDLRAETLIHQVQIYNDQVLDSNGRDIKFDMGQFTAWQELNTCPECDEGCVEIGPECSRPASNCCGGCFRKEKCETCDGSGLININL